MTSTMDSFQNLDLRPVKRRRVEMATPDGFLETPNLPPKAVHKPVVPKFSSAFGDAAYNVPQRKEHYPSNALVKKPLSSRFQEVFDPATLKENIGGHANAADSSNRKPRKVVSVKDVRDEFLREASVKPNPLPQLRLPLCAPPLPLVTTTSTSKVALKRIIAPELPIKPPSKVLLPIQPPANIVAHTSRNNAPLGKDLRTISTTGLGRFTDLSSENGADELASILLRDQHPELHTDAKVADTYTQRGLELSPEKKGKGNAPKFVKGGLAARASAHFDQTRTAFILWRRQIEIDLQRMKTLPSGADICADVLKILHKPLSVSNSRPGSHLPVIALCRVRHANGKIHALFKADHLYRVVFSYPDRMSTDSRLEELSSGHLVRVFKPWSEMSFSRSGILSVAPRIPANLPLPNSLPFSTPDPLDAPVHDTILFCSRFFIA
ncbi:hypothetical protein HYPSUDRAFT_208139 [Hypholoma sublateritium FD-334 SS-4]|uniref:Uncharacterized protein n=1 Tax=Hypholoma sublateritium (strain FD-334 SS-4) TaxID=945553 RepID=A0A0D2NES6_HYPSF|nr:hypothetical protein HYPSUDRAFT_208139 [Hypholoma sublateritium FD-334 SS-4]